MKALPRLALPLLFLTFHFASDANEPSQGSATFEIESTSDLLLRRSLLLSYRNHRRDLFWPYPNAKDTAWDLGFQFQTHYGIASTTQYSGVEGQAIIAKKFSPTFMSQLELGFHRLTNQTDSRDVSLPTLGLITQWIASKKVKLSNTVQRNFIYPNMALPGGVTNSIHSSRLLTKFMIRPADKIRTQLTTEYEWYSDENLKRRYEVSALYGIATATPWIWVGLGAEYLTFSREISGYWTPSGFLSLGIRTESSFPIWKQLSGSLSFNGNRIHDKASRIWGYGYYGSAKIRYGDRDKNHFSLFFNRIESAQNGSTWSSNQIGLSGVIFL